MRVNCVHVCMLCVPIQVCSVCAVRVVGVCMSVCMSVCLCCACAYDRDSCHLGTAPPLSEGQPVLLLDQTRGPPWGPQT